MPKCRDGFVIAVFEGLQVDWSAIVVDSLRSAIASIVDRKKAWCGLAQWLTLLVPLVHAVKPKKWGRLETTSNKSSKQQLLENTPRDGQ